MDVWQNFYFGNLISNDWQERVLFSCVYFCVFVCVCFGYCDSSISLK